jgi:hypothetical protein
VGWIPGGFGGFNCKGTTTDGFDIECEHRDYNLRLTIKERATCLTAFEFLVSHVPPAWNRPEDSYYPDRKTFERALSLLDLFCEAANSEYVASRKKWAQEAADKEAAVRKRFFQ